MVRPCGWPFPEPARLVTRVQVLLSTYNGERYLPELLDSLVRQNGVSVEVLARDDGSSDGTWDMLERHGTSLPLVRHRGEHLGVVGSYLWLLEHASPHVDYIALADQDDVWMEEKLRRATERLSVRGNDEPAIYCSRLTLVDERLRVLGHSKPAPRGPSFQNSLVENIATGCTIVLNQAARAIIDRGYPGVAFMHDWWIYQVIAGFGTVLYDDQSFILYRQHGANAVGDAHSRLGRFIARLRRAAHRGFRPFSAAQLKELERIHGRFLPRQHQAVLRRHLAARWSPAARARLALGQEVVFQTGWQQAVFRCLLLLNRL